jgi:hypothetical protein
MGNSKNILLHWWLGLSLATLFFYPLISALSDRSFYMHWGHGNTLEFFAAILTTGTLMGFLLLLTEKTMEPGRGKTIVTLALVVVPFLSLLTYIGWQLGITAWVKTVTVGMAPLFKYGLIALIIAELGYVTWRYHEVLRPHIITAILVISPLNVFAAATVVRAGCLGPTLTIHAQAQSEEGSVESIQRNIFVLLFDELDYGFLYWDGEVRADFPNIKAFAATAYNYHRAFSPGTETLTAIPGLLCGRKVKVNDRQGVDLYEVSDTGEMSPLDIADTSVFSLARGLGFKAVMYGWMFPYCEMLKRNMDECRAFSIYNYATISDSLSIANPILTNIILSPHSIPVGFLKTPIYSQFHHKIASRIYDLAVSSLSIRGPLFEIVHINIPHSPFVYDGVRYEPASDPWLQNEESYVKQLKHVDHLVGQFLSVLEKSTKSPLSDVIIMSDHGYRAMVPKSERDRVPFIIKQAGQTMRQDIYAPVRTESLIREILVNPDDHASDVRNGAGTYNGMR